MIEQLKLDLIERRRYVINARCPINGIHEAILMDEIVASSEDPTRFATPIEIANSAWPISCVCGRAFDQYDPFIVERSRLWHPIGQHAVHWKLHDVPAGAMWDAPWMKRFGWVGEDGLSLFVQTPSGPWHIDGCAPSGARWKRYGDAPFVTVTPEISLRRLEYEGAEIRAAYHADLIAGVLINR